MNMEDVEAQLRYSAMLFHDRNWFNEVEELVKSIVKTKRTINSKLISVSVALSDWKSSLPPTPTPLNGMLVQVSLIITICSPGWREAW